MFLPGESQGWGSLVGCRLWGHTESVRHDWSNLAAPAAASPSGSQLPPPSAPGWGQDKVRRRCLLLSGLGDPQLETSKLFIAEPSRGGRPERLGSSSSFLSSYRICRNPRPLLGKPCVYFWVDMDLSLEKPYVAVGFLCCSLSWERLILQWPWVLAFRPLCGGDIWNLSSK